MNSSGSELPVFGQVVLEKGLATRDVIEECIRLQSLRAEAGDFVRLGQIFVQRGILSPEQVQEVLRSQRVQIRVCRRCRAQFNQSSGTALATCPRCGGDLEAPGALHSTAVEDTVAPGAEAEEAERERGLKILNQRTRSFGPFEIIGEISRGGMGIVYKARERELDRIVALKVLIAGGESAAEDVDRFEREARAVARLRHPSIVEIHRIGVHQGIHYFSMNYIQGISLDQLLEERSFEPLQLLETVARIADAVDYSHRNGVLHRDIKPSNILINQQGDPYLIDFGIAKFKDDRKELTRRGTFLGSPQYMAPEYISGRSRQFDARSDVYALGVTLYKCLTGKLPYPDGDTIQVLQQVLAGPPPLEKSLKAVPRDLALICHRALEREPQDRYQSAGEMSADLDRFLRGEEVSVRPRGVVFRVQRWLRDRASLVFNVALSLSLVLVFYTLHSTARAHASRAEELERQMVERTQRLRYDFLVERGRRHLAEGDPGAALSSLDAAVDLDRERPEAFRVRAVAHERLGHAPEAEADLVESRRHSKE